MTLPLLLVDSRLKVPALWLPDRILPERPMPHVTLVTTIYEMGFGGFDLSRYLCTRKPCHDRSIRVDINPESFKT